MNKKIIVIGIVSIFLLTGYSAVSEGITKKDVNNQSFRISEEPTDIIFDESEAYVDLLFADDYEIKINFDDPINVDDLMDQAFYENVRIKASQKTGDFLSIAYSRDREKLADWLQNSIFGIIFRKIAWLIDDRFLDHIYLFRYGDFTIETPAMKIKNKNVDPHSGLPMLFFYGQDVIIYQ